MLDLAVFVPRLKQVIAWTEHLMQHFTYPPDRQNHGAIFRQINPIINGQLLYSSDWGYTSWNLDVYDLNNFEQALQIALKQRDAEAVVLDFNSADFQKLGRILFFETQVTTHDGAAIAESNCFVDESDVPPIDTWFYLDQDVKRQVRKAPSLFFWIPKQQVKKAPNLLCWIPKQFESVMQAAINAEIFDSYHWLDEASPFVYQQIVAAMSA